MKSILLIYFKVCNTTLLYSRIHSSIYSNETSTHQAITPFSPSQLPGKHHSIGYFYEFGRLRCLSSVQFSSVAQSCPTLCDPMNRSTPGLPVHHQLPEFTQTHVHRVGDAIQPSHPLSSPSPPAPNPSQHQSFPMSQLFACGGQSTGVSALASFLPKKSQG